MSGAYLGYQVYGEDQDEENEGFSADEDTDVDEDMSDEEGLPKRENPLKTKMKQWIYILIYGLCLANQGYESDICLSTRCAAKELSRRL